MDGFRGDRGGGGFDRDGGYDRDDRRVPRGRPGRRDTTDIGTTYAYWMHKRRGPGKSSRGFEAERPASSYTIDMLPPVTKRTRPADVIPAKHLHLSKNKMLQAVNVVKWTPEGRRLLTAAGSGEFTLWNGTGFNFETISQAHEESIYAVTYSHNNEWLLSGDKNGQVKYWQPNFSEVSSIQAHADDITVRDIAFAPTDERFVTAADDNSLKIWDFANRAVVSELLGHTWDVKCADWHPTKGLIVSGSKDHQVKLWDPRDGKCLTTLRGHNNTLCATKFEPNNGVLLASSAREPITRIFDLRMMRDVFLLKSDSQGVTTMTWHPIHSSLLSTGTQEGAINHYLLDEPNALPGTTPQVSPYDSPNSADAPAQTLYPAHRTAYAHNNIIWSMDWHPLGHILATGSNDRTTKFWTRPRPGDDSWLFDAHHIGEQAAKAKGTWKGKDAARQRQEEEDDEADGLEDQRMPVRSQLPGLPGLPGLASRPMPSFPDGTSTGGAQPLPGFTNGALPFPPPGQPGAPPLDLEALKAQFGGLLPPLPPPGANGQLPPGFPPMPPNLQGLPGFPPPGNLPGIAGAPNAGAGGGSVRRRAPLPSQQESLEAEMRQGRYTKAR
ncbi:Polyadenylation factor subunit 2 [Teratosphaeria destructans]|uniref:Polyadenylation factor subunit 2 n=1 Tax=Teratosphaeria destructans TaxID=418781 RepID=A0A9W7SNT1_9PEZI|nr:Polyadenylation factor subunit 2 [Teratosphaeria destructans]